MQGEGKKRKSRESVFMSIAGGMGEVCEMPRHFVKYSSRDYCIELIELSLILIDIFALSYPHRHRGGARYLIC